MNKFSIIIPTLNEADNINPLLRLIGAVNQPLGLSPEIIFVDDGSTDSTRQNIDAYSGDLEVRLIRRDTQTGLTGAVVAGARAASKSVWKFWLRQLNRCAFWRYPSPSSTVTPGLRK
jgi:dolichol-phosphate mannosyltransferase